MRAILLFTFLVVSANIFSQTDTISWQKLSSLPDSSRLDFGYFIIDSAFYIVDGSGSSLFNTVWKYNINSNQWQSMSNFQGGAATGQTGFAINGKGYICFGIYSGNYTNEVWEYDPVGDIWQQKANFPGGSKSFCSSFVYNGFGYICLGISGVTSSDARRTWRYDPVSDRWDSLGLFPLAARVGMQIIQKDSFAYLFSGDDYINNIICKDIWRYNINQDHWDSIDLIPGHPRTSPLFWSLDNSILGGYGILEDSLGYLSLGSDCYRYSIASNQWNGVICENFLDSIAGSSNGATFTYKEKAYFFGGYKTYNYNGGAQANYTLYKDIWSFDASRFLGDTISGITNINATDINIYPIPANDMLYIANPLSNSTLTIYDMTGRVCLTPISSQQTAGVVSIDVSALPAGVYCLHIQDSGGSVVRKFVKE